MRNNWFAFLIVVASAGNALADGLIPYTAVEPNPNGLEQGDTLTLKINAIHPDIQGRTNITISLPDPKTKDWTVQTAPLSLDNTLVFRALPLFTGKKEFPGLQISDATGTVVATTEKLTVQVNALNANTEPPSRQDPVLKSFPWFRFIVLFISLMVAIAGMVFLYLKRRPPAMRRNPVDTGPTISPLEQAWMDIEAIRKTLLNIEGKELKQVSHRTSDLVRAIYSYEHNKDFDDLTTRELIRELEQYLGSNEQTRLLRSLLNNLDVVRFAENRTTANETRQLLIQLESWRDYKRGKSS
jgi:hypothetical protein